MPTPATAPLDPIVAPPIPVITALPPGDPTIEGFKFFVTNMMGVPTEAMPDDAMLQMCYDQAYNLAYWGLATIPYAPLSPSLFAFAVYNLGCAFLVQFAYDDPTAPPPYNTFWTSLRQKLGIGTMSYGLINSAADQGTSETQYIPDVIKGMTLLDLQLLKSPWGQAYLMIAGEWGSLWGLTI